MSILLILALIADAVFLIASQSNDAWAAQVCTFVGMCANPVPFLILGIILTGIYFVQR